MFIQVIEGRIDDADAVRARFEAWHRDLRPAGYLGSTHGLAEDGSWISIVRFESQPAARPNDEQREQTAWWKGTTPLFREVRVDDCSEVDVVLPGSDDAGFVQVLRGRTNDKAALRALLKEIAPIARRGRPFLIGAVYGWHGDHFTNTVYFTSEAAARQGELGEPPPHMERWRALVDDLRFLDLPAPILLSPETRVRHEAERV